jgi:hypothetical protein
MPQKVLPLGASCFDGGSATPEEVVIDSLATCLKSNGKSIAANNAGVGLGFVLIDGRLTGEMLWQWIEDISLGDMVAVDVWV